MAFCQLAGSFFHSELRQQRATASPPLWTVHWRVVASPGHTAARRGVRQGPTEALYDALFPVYVNPTAPNLDRVLRQQLTDGAHELTTGINMKKLWPPQGASLVNPSKTIGDLCRSLASQGLSLFVAAGDVNDRESITEGFPSYAVVWQEMQVGLMDLVWYRHVKFRPWYVSWSRQIAMPDGLLLEPVLGLLLSHLCCRRQLFDGRKSLPVTSGTSKCLQVGLTAFYLPQICGSHGPRSLSSCVVLCCFATSNKSWSGPKK